MRTSCPLVLVDAGEDSDRIAAAVAGRPGTTVIVTGIGPSEGSHASALQEIYLAPAVRGGWLTSASTRRTGVVDLTDLTSTLIDRSGDTAVTPSVVDGSALQLTIGAVNAADEQQHLRAVAALSDAVIPVDIGLGAVGVAAVAVWVVSTRRRNYALARVPATAGCSAPAAMLLTGAVPWSSTVAPITTLALSWVGWAVLLTLSVLAISRRTGWPTAAVAAALTVAAFTAEAVLGGPMEPGSLLNSRPVNGGRWYGFGNVTFGFYAAAALVLAGYLGHRYLLAHQRVVAAIAVAMVGFGVAACDGWPTMGADFGGVLTLVPVISWLTLAIAGLRITAPRMIAGATAAAAAATLIAWLDWRRGPAARSHLGNFVQRIIDGDAQDIVIRKAAAAAASLTGPFGIIAVLTGVLAWLAVFRVLPRLVDRFTTLRPVAIAALATAVIGSLVNDGGVSVWATITASFAVSVAALQTDRLLSTAVRQRQLTGETPLAGQGATAVP